MQRHLKKLLKHTKRLKEKVFHLADLRQKESEPQKHLPVPKPEKVDRVVVELSLGSVAKATILIILLYFLTTFLSDIKDILVLVFVAVFLSAALDPAVDKLQEKKIPRALGVLIIYLGVFVFLFFFISQLIPLLATQIGDLADKIVIFFKNLTTNGKSDLPFSDKWLPILNDLLETVDEETLLKNLQEGLKGLATQLKGIAGNTWSALAVVFNSILNAVIVLVLTFFMVVEENTIENFIRSLFPSKYSQYIVTKTSEIKDKVGNWLRGQIILSVVMGTVTGLGFLFMGVEYAATLGMVAALAEFLPMIGPTITFLAGALIASNESLWLVVGVAGWCIVMQILEGNVFIPLIMKKAVGLSPVVIIISMLIGFNFLGILGVIISLPVATVISIFIEDYARKDK